ncbi:tRNA-dependent cyclodipeptide synthase [Kitasatospora sp. NPDC096147]|uniref:tRNA-dependent cyclodipeptide synthase n=1 Tax=Kitasatospora sp. NPDC096147 TaxID=3364093 RepID=UPI00380B4133
MTETLLSTSSSTFQALPFSDRCHRVWQRGDHLLIGVSPGNSYFSQLRIAQLVRWGRQFFAAVDVVHADLHVDAQYAVHGYPAELALRRAAKEVKATRRRIERGVALAGRAGVGVHALSEFTGTAAYRRLRGEVATGLAEDAELRAATELMAAGFLASRLAEGEAPTADQLAAGIGYIAAELPFFLDTPSLLGVESSVSCYHVELPLTPVLFGRDHGLRAAPGQGYAVIRPRVAPQLASAA